MKRILFGLLMIAAASIAFIGLVGAPGASAAATSTQSASTKVKSTTTDTPPPPCPTGDTCVTIPCSSDQCPTVQAGPAKDVGTNPAQYTFVHLYNFPAGDVPQVYTCADTVPLSQAAPMCDVAKLAYAPIFSDGTSFISDLVTEDLNQSGAIPNSGQILGDASDKGTFWCDNSPDPCSIDIWDQGIDNSLVPDENDFAVIPITFQPSNVGCPGSTLVNTESDWGIEGLIESGNQNGCVGKYPVVDFNTELDSASAVNDLASGSVQIAFTDDPESPDEQATLGAKGSQYALIPIAESADVVGFSAIVQSDISTNHSLYPQTSYDLTPNMVAGMTNAAYTAEGNSDVIPGVSCANPGNGPKKFNPCPAMMSVNGLTGFQPETEYSTYLRSDTAGVTDELFHWLCTAPDHTVPLNGTTATETQTGAQVLQATDWSQTSLKGTCPSTDLFPGIAGQAVSYAAATPENQAKALYAQVQTGDPPRQTGFAIMNWYEGLYYGLLPASLQNAAGQFVAPSETSVDAAINDATANPDGSLNFSYTNTTDQAAYPEPVVFYAAVSTAKQPAAQADAEKTVLNNILALTGSASKSSLPAGIIPLTSGLTTTAETDITKDIVAAPPTTTTTTTTTTATSTPGGSSHTGTTTGNGTGTGTTTTYTTTPPPGGFTGAGTGSSSPGKAITTQKTKPQSTKPKEGSPKPSPPSVFKAIQVALATPQWRWLLVVMLLAGGIAVCAGPLLLVTQRLRRRLAGAKSGHEEEKG